LPYALQIQGGHWPPFHLVELRISYLLIVECHYSTKNLIEAKIINEQAAQA
jgi:hypothetical protein